MLVGLTGLLKCLLTFDLFTTSVDGERLCLLNYEKFRVCQELTWWIVDWLRLLLVHQARLCPEKNTNRFSGDLEKDPLVFYDKI